MKLRILDLRPITYRASTFFGQSLGYINFSVVKSLDICDMVKRSATISTERGTSSCRGSGCHPDLVLGCGGEFGMVEAGTSKTRQTC